MARKIIPTREFDISIESDDDNEIQITQENISAIIDEPSDHEESDQTDHDTPTADSDEKIPSCDVKIKIMRLKYGGTW